MAEPIKMPSLGSDMTEGLLLNWTRSVGDTIKDGDVIAEIETDKATVEVPATAAGTILALIGEPGETLNVGAVIGWVGEAGEAVPEGGAAPAARPAAAKANGAAPAEARAPEAQPAPAPQPEAAEEDEGGADYPGGVKASPVARRLAEEKGIDLRQVHGTGPGGRIIKSDVESFQPSAAPVRAAEAAGIPAAQYGDLPSGPDVEIIEVSKLRSRIATRMVQSKQQVPHFYVTSDIDVEALLSLRKQLNAMLDDEHKISVNDMIVKAVALTLRQFPNLNSHFYGDRIARFKRINIGMAVALPNGGLVNVVAQDADKTALGTIAVENKAMIARARDGKVRPDDVQGSTFTVSNLGAYDVEHFLAIINPPEAGILAVSTAAKVPVVKEDGTVGVGNRMKVTISVDHRVSDGAEAAQFLQTFKQLVENPMQLLI